MKKYISILCILCVIIGLFSSCSSSAKSDTTAKENAAPTEEGMDMEAKSEVTYDEEPQDFSEEMPLQEKSDSIEDEALYGTQPESGSGEEYNFSPETGFLSAQTQPLSTFSADVDTASYSNMRRQVLNGQTPQGIRIEEMVNYFNYDYKPPAFDSEVPFSVTTEVSSCPWNEQNQLAMVGIQGKRLNSDEKVSNNIVFLLDVSGSMFGDNKLGLLQKSFIMMLQNFDKDDVISIVTYAGNESIVADSVKGNEKPKLAKLIKELEAGGSTAGYSAIQTAYDLSEKNFIENGNNRIILATDGDFNVGLSSDDELKNLVESKRDKNIFLSVLGFGMGNLKDSKMETLADNGNGNYAYIDTIAEAKKVLVDEFDATMFTIAKDVKFQVEFNPAVVAEYRLIGYNNRRLENKDFDDDTKDAGEIGSGHSVTAFYEIVPVNKDNIDLKYQQTPENTTGSTDYFTVKLRYKNPDEDTSKLIEHVVTQDSYVISPSTDFGFASSVVEYGLILSNSEYKGNSSLENLLSRAKDSVGSDEYGLRKEFIEIAKQYNSLFG